MEAKHLWNEALNRASELARGKLGPGASGRIEKALRLVRGDHLTFSSSGTCMVEDGGTVYQPNGECGCSEKPEDGVCSHKIARGLLFRAREIVKTLKMPAPPERQAPGGHAGDPVRSGTTYAEALELISATYHRYLHNIKGQAYLAVDGRVALAVDEHRQQGAALTIDTAFIDVGGKMLCRAYVTSAAYGSATGHAIVPLDALSGAEASNPFEVAETSAVGRALGFMGYGLFGGGIASAEEMESTA